MSGRLRSIQALRAVAALLVVIHHAATIGRGGAAAQPLFAALPSFNDFGAAGVDIFFVISGFVMAQSIGATTGTPKPRRFLVRRAARILPLFWLMNVSQIVTECLIHRTPPDPLALLNAATVLPLTDVATFEAHPAPVYVSWSLGFEAVFYLVVAAVLRVRPARPVPLLLGLTLALAAAGLIVTAENCPASFAANPIFLEFALGIGAWLLWRNGRAARFAPIFVPAGVLLFAAGLTMDLGESFGVDPGLVIRGETSVIRSLVWGVPAFLLVVGLAEEPGASSRTLAAAALLGDASYALYLVHPQIVSLLGALTTGAIHNDVRLFAAVVTSVAIAAAWLLHRHVEAPLIAALAGRRRISGAFAAA